MEFPAFYGAQNFITVFINPIQLNTLQIVSVITYQAIKTYNLINHHAMETYGSGGSAPRLHAFLTSAIDILEFSASQSGRFILGKDPPIPVVWEAG
jgi:hypothetical protein